MVDEELLLSEIWSVRTHITSFREVVRSRDKLAASLVKLQANLGGITGQVS